MKLVAEPIMNCVELRNAVEIPKECVTNDIDFDIEFEILKAIQKKNSIQGSNIVQKLRWSKISTKIIKIPEVVIIKDPIKIKKSKVYF
ncbi:MAG: hypothetical protein Tsb0021_03920 [Chlamydiales bacterium]